MGIGMQIVYLGFPGAAGIEAEAAVQLLRLEHFYNRLSGCHLAVEALRSEHGRIYDVRLDLTTCSGELIALRSCANADPDAALAAAFDRAMDALRQAKLGDKPSNA
jgi:hypothetical protein